MKNSSRKIRLSRRCLIILSFLYLFLQTGLFLQGWFTPAVAIPLIVAILGSLGIYFFCFSKADASDQWILKRRDTGLILLAVFTIFSIHVIGGLPGWFFPEHSDQFVFRQALYLNLIHAPWPLILPNGREMTYYLAGVLPSAMAARILPSSYQQIPILFNTLIPVLLTVLLFWQRWKKASLLSLIVLFFISEPSRLFFPLPGAPFTETFYGLLQENFDIKNLIPGSIFLCGNYTLLAPILETLNAYNSNPASFMAAALLLQLKESKGLIPLCIALLTPISPLGALALLPIAVWMFFSGGRIRVSTCIIPILLATTVALYFLRVDSELNVIAPTWHLRGMRFWVFHFRYLLGVAFLIVPLWFFRKHDGLYLMTALSVILLPLLYIGSLPSTLGIWGVNELTVKGGPIYSLILGSMWCEDWRRIHQKIRWCMSALLTVTILTFLLVQTREFNPHDCHIKDFWNGHLCHDRLFLKQSIPDVKEPLLPGVLFRTSGESEQHFPGRLLPKADGKCPYGTPPAPDAFP